MTIVADVIGGGGGSDSILLATRQGVQVASRGWKKQGHKFSPRTSGKNAVLPIHFGLLCQTWEERSLLKSVHWAWRPPPRHTTLPVSSSGALLLLEAPNWPSLSALLAGPYNSCLRSQRKLSTVLFFHRPLFSLFNVWRTNMQIFRWQLELFFSLTCLC